jgi:hypothetical protein
MRQKKETYFQIGSSLPTQSHPHFLFTNGVRELITLMMSGTLIKINASF